MIELGLNAYFLPHSDPHRNEYLSDHDKRIGFITGFKGSNAHTLITQEQALLWTDGRYWQEAEKELYEGWNLMKITSGVPTYYEWCIQNLPKDSIIGYDPSIVTADAAINRTKYFVDKGYQFLPIERNIVNEIWENRPELSQEPIIIFDEKYAGESFTKKIKRVAEEMGDKNFYLVTALDEIAWTLNLRGKDVEYNPVFFSYLILEKRGEENKIHLFVNEGKVANIREYLEGNRIQIYPYESASSFLSAIEESVIVDSTSCNYQLFKSIKNPEKKESIITNLKAIKNSTEIQGFRNSHIRDGVAVCKYLAWLGKELEDGHIHNEYEAALKLNQYRSEEDLNMGLSFANISCSGPNASFIHYHPEPDNSSEIKKDQIYLLDSGGQYLDGTIDTTRTVHYGNPTDWEKECYTRVLLGNLDLERVVWPYGTWGISGADLDILARRRLWKKGLDFQHGTGHGVGHYLNVHEGPQGISRARKIQLEEGMNVTNEPGYYEKGNFGIRIENVMFVAKHPTIENFLCFENVTRVPYDKNLILLSMLNDEDKAYINAYHQIVYDTLSPILRSRNDDFTLNWLEKATSPIE
eukprot:CAMPEP_0202940690 /NCGR_PEP_ID=MMETSP1395-20130829/821_1 /ASSEMBLY_ACC=CAM_ASM_000871 /TAXON_ID=5961 /ORGANISM="Blepharisma japonicum, Strain Stock R1072" /LENGTH=580 /DNA_ID=CAMNT_0049635313 /DNA_START=41 /DNA_END=1783 /DNA_ORIENTATION=+